MKNLFRFTILFVLIFSISACASSQTDDNPAAILETLDITWNAKDVEGVLALLHDGRICRVARLQKRDRIQMGGVESPGKVFESRGGTGVHVECGASEVVWRENGE